MLQAGRRDSELVIFALIVGGVLYGLLAYFLVPLVWRHYEHQKALAGLTMITHTHDGIPGDPINVGAVGSEADLLCAMHAAQWFPADPVTLRSSVEIVGSVLLDRPYRGAPVSPLYCQGKRQDFAFEKPAGKSPAPASPCPLLESARPRRRGKGGLARGGDLRSRCRLQS